jgi:hypothetical protein
MNQRSLPALVPTGLLTKDHVPPFSGELKNGISFHGVNLAHLSGTDIRFRNLALFYANSATAFDPKYEVRYLLSLSVSDTSQFLRAKIAALRLTVLGDETAEYKAIINHLLQEREKDSSSHSLHEESGGKIIYDPYQTRSTWEALTEIIDILEHQQPINFSDEELQFIRHPSPIVWGSFTVNPVELDLGQDVESIVEGTQVLGRDIQVLFAPEAKIDSIRSYIRAYLPHEPHLFILPKYLLETAESVPKKTVSP